MANQRPDTVAIRASRAAAVRDANSLIHPIPEVGDVSRPSVMQWTRTGMRARSAHSRRACRWPISLWTPPSEHSPIRWSLPPVRPSFAARSPNSGRAKKDPSRIDVEIRVTSWWTIRPAPRFRWPTSEFPIWPGGSPTISPEVRSMHQGRFSSSRSRTGVGAMATALPCRLISGGVEAPTPQPSQMIRTVGFLLSFMEAARQVHGGFRRTGPEGFARGVRLAVTNLTPAGRGTGTWDTLGRNAWISGVVPHHQ